MYDLNLVLKTNFDIKKAPSIESKFFTYVRHLDLELCFCLQEKFVSAASTVDGMRGGEG
jgi:hypothetical protein